ncbi:hypothetical protein RZS08_35610, partial [Arthrospira platensis SPKY1]|nr:hypothetical protein [Arthrospira platensis SPKY1]
PERQVARAQDLGLCLEVLLIWRYAGDGLIDRDDIGLACLEHERTARFEDGRNARCDDVSEHGGDHRQRNDLKLALGDGAPDLQEVEPPCVLFMDIQRAGIVGVLGGVCRHW